MGHRLKNSSHFPPIRLWARLYPQFCKTLLIRISSRFPMRSGFSPIASRKTSLARKNSQFRGSSLVIRSGVSSHFSTVSSQASLMVYCSWTLAASCSASRNWIPPDAETPHEPQPKVKEISFYRFHVDFRHFHGEPATVTSLVRKEFVLIGGTNEHRATRKLGGELPVFRDPVFVSTRHKRFD